MEYSHIFGSNFPTEIIDVGTKKDVDDTVVSLINRYYQYVEANDINGANQFYNENKDVLDSYAITCADWNRLEEEIYNTGTFSLERFTIIVSDIEPESQSVGSYWLQEW